MTRKKGKRKTSENILTFPCFIYKRKSLTGRFLISFVCLNLCLLARKRLAMLEILFHKKKRTLYKSDFENMQASVIHPINNVYYVLSSMRILNKVTLITDKTIFLKYCIELLCIFQILNRGPCLILLKKEKKTSQY